MIHGENLILAINGTPLAASKSCSLSKSSSFIEVASPTAGDWESFVPSKKGWSMSADCLLGTMAAYKTLDAAWKAGTALTIRFFNTEYDENETGTAYIDNLNLDASKGNLAKMSISLKGSGPLSEYAGVEIPLTDVQPGGVQGAKYNINGSYAYYDDTDQDYEFNCRRFTLSKRTKVMFSLTYCTVIFSDEIHILQDAENQSTIDLQERNADYLLDTYAVWLNAGTYYAIFSTDDARSWNYKIYNIS